ncbi:MAG: hypothetical protein ACFFAQ_07000 [Promethearchaeota archaeon]
MEYYKIQIKKVLKSLGIIFMVLSGYTLFWILGYGIGDRHLIFFLPTSVEFAYFIGSIILFSVGYAIFVIGNSLYES